MVQGEREGVHPDSPARPPTTPPDHQRADDQQTARPARTSIPPVIQGGMGVGVSGWPLARAVSRAGQLGVVSATCLDTVMVRRLQDGDPGGHTRRALAHFPSQDAVREVLDRYFLPGGRAAGQPYRRVPLPGVPLQPENERLTVMANFVEVWLAREGHGGTVGVNLLTKVQLQTLPGLYGAVLAGVHVVLMGAGIPRDVPQVLDRFAAGQAAITDCP